MSIFHNKLCEGCTLYSKFLSGNSPCYYPYRLKSGEECPCCDCIIKVTCSLACDKLIVYEFESNIERKNK